MSKARQGRRLLLDNGPILDELIGFLTEKNGRGERTAESPEAREALNQSLEGLGSVMLQKLKFDSTIQVMGLQESD